jgi:hypothetical protein
MMCFKYERLTDNLQNCDGCKFNLSYLIENKRSFANETYFGITAHKNYMNAEKFQENERVLFRLKIQCIKVRNN